MQNFHDVSALVDPRPFDGTRFTYRGMPLLPVSYDVSVRPDQVG
jgi:hypothetical protein